MVRLVYLNYGVALGSPVPPGSKAWLDAKLGRPLHSVERAREFLREAGFGWSGDGALTDETGVRVEFTIAVSASNSQRLQMATLIQDDLKRVGMKVSVVPLEFRSLVNRVKDTFEYDAAILSLQSSDADPNVETSVWLTGGPNHVWRLSQGSQLPPWEVEIDSLMQRQMGVTNSGERKRLFDRVQQLAMEHLPLIPLVSPNVLTGAKRQLSNFRPALLDHNTLWNFEELYWRPSSGVPGK
jgi:peptide/nickel transport system substrate-binding protein